MGTPRLPPLRVVSHRFSAADLCAGHLALDFLNTAASLNRGPRDWLDGYTRLVEWAGLAGICDPDRQQQLFAASAQHPRAGDEALTRVRVFRAALYELVSAWAAGVRPSTYAVAELQRWSRRGGRALSLRWLDCGALGTSIASCGLDVIGVEVALAATELLSQPAVGRVGVCAGYNCGWMFLDTSKSRRRRWCDMRTCGNAAKAHRHYRKRSLATRIDAERE